MDTGLLAVAIAPTLMALAWSGIALRALGSPRWALGALSAAVLAGGLMLIAAYPPAGGVVAALGIPALCVAAGLLLQVAFARPLVLATALSGAVALLIVASAPVFPVVMPLVVALPLWVVALVDRGGVRLAGLFLASLVLVPVVVIGTFLLIRR